MPTSMMRVRVHVQDDPELKGIGDGAKRFIGWVLGDGSYRLFYVPALLLFPPITPERFKEMKAEVEESPIAKPDKFVEAIKANRSSNQTNGVWDGGTYAMKIIDKLLGVPVDDSTFEDSGDAIAQEEAVKAEPTEEAPKGKGKKPPEPPPAAVPFQRGDRVYRKSDSEQKPGTITDAGPEQSEVKWDDTDFGRGFDRNEKFVLIPKEATVPSAAAKRKTTKAAKAPKAKAAKAPKAIKWPEGKLHWLVDENPRRSGTRAHEVVGKVMKMGHPSLEAASEKGYTLTDFEFDKKRKHVELKK